MRVAICLNVVSRVFEIVTPPIKNLGSSATRTQRALVVPRTQLALIDVVVPWL